MSTWRDRAVCRHDPELFFTKADRADAVHVCRHHCPVARQCHAEFRSAVNIDVVVGGVAYGATGEPLKDLGRATAAHGRYCWAIELGEERPADRRDGWRPAQDEEA